MTKHAGGRPSGFTQEIADRICEQLMEGISLRTACLPEDMPSLSMVFRWLFKYPKFREQYDKAKAIGIEAMAEDILDISDDGTNDYMTITRGNKDYNVEDREVTNRSKLRVDTRKWIMSKLVPKKYGDKMDIKHEGEINVIFDSTLKQDE